MEVSDSSLIEVLNSTTDSIIWFNEEKHILFFNSGASQTFGYSETEAFGILFDDLLIPQYRDFFSQHLETITNHTPVSQIVWDRKEIIAVKKGQETFPAEVSISKSSLQATSIYLVILRDISDRKLAEEARLQSENRYSGLIESRSDLIVRVDPEGKFTFANKAYCEKFGKTLQELMGKTYTALVHPDDLPQTLESVNSLYAPPFRVIVEQRAMTVEGWRWLVWEDSIIHDENGNIIEIQGVGRDITESKENHQLLIAQRDLAQKLAETSMINEALKLILVKILQASGMDCGGIYLVDQPTGDLKLVTSIGLSEAFLKNTLFYKANSDRWQLVMQGKSIFGTFHNLPVSQLQDANLEGLKGFMLLPISHQGKIIGCFNLASHIQDGITENGRLAAEMLSIQVASTIIRLLTEENLAESRAELETLFNGITDYLVVFNQEGNIIKVNQQVIDRLGYAENELIDQPVLKLHPKEFHQQATEIIVSMLEGRLKTCPLDLLAKDGTCVPVETRVDAGKIRGQQVWIGISRDVTEHKQLDNGLKKSREQLSLAIEGSGAGLWDWKVKTGELDINEQWAGITGYSLQDLSPISIETWPKLCHPDDLIKSNVLLQKHFAHETPFYECELRMLHKDGHWVWVLDRGRVTEWGDQDDPVRMTGTHLDITARRAMEDKLKYRLDFENLLTRLSTRFINLKTAEIDKEITKALGEIGEFENVDRCYIFSINNGEKTMSNTHEWCGVGIEPQIDVLQDLPLDIFPWWMKKLENNDTIIVPVVENMPDEATAEKEILQAQSIASIAVIPIYVNNHLFSFAGFDSVNSVKNWGPDSIALLQQFGNIIGNLIERMRVENALQMSETRNSAILKAIPDNIFRINQDGVILDYFASDYSNLMLPAENIRGSHISATLGKDTSLIAFEKIRSAISSGQKQTLEYQLTLQGQVVHFEARIVASGGNEVIAIVRDVSERARLEQMKSDFINRATHDLRTPLTTILLMVRLLEGDCTPEERSEFWAVMKEELDRERELIEDLLTVGRLESKQWVAKLQLIDPLNGLKNSIQAILPQAAQKNISLNLHDSPEKFLVMGDPNAMEQIFVNLLSNAVKFTPSEGMVDISYCRRANKGYFKVQDTGIGIPPEDVPNMFNRFFRGRNAIENEIQGSGIGLFIVKAMIENFGGQVTLESKLEKGTTVEFWLPIADDSDQYSL